MLRIEQPKILMCKWQKGNAGCIASKRAFYEQSPFEANGSNPMKRMIFARVVRSGLVFRFSQLLSVFLETANRSAHCTADKPSSVRFW
jgi:hypothetical protein